MMTNEAMVGAIGQRLPLPVRRNQTEQITAE